MTLFLDLVKYVFILPYSIGATLNTAFQLLMYSFKLQNFATRTFAEGLNPTLPATAHIENIIDIWIPIYLQPEPSDIPLMFTYWLLGIIVYAVTPNDVLEEVGLA